MDGLQRWRNVCQSAVQKTEGCKREEKMTDGKTCPKCGEWKKRSQYYKHSTSPDGLQHWCRVCKSATQKTEGSKAYTKSYYLKHKERIRRRVIRNTRRRRRELKRKCVKHLGGECLHCGLQYTPCNLPIFDFHHRNPDEKEFTIGHGLHAETWEKVKAELEKCDLLCANCHRLVHTRYI
jgi:predicted HNH restriction endonuclease